MGGSAPCQQLRVRPVQLMCDLRTLPSAGQVSQEAVPGPHPLSSLHVLKQPLENRTSETAI